MPTKRQQTSRYNMSLRQMYLALLVPAVARINKERAHQTVTERATAVRQAAHRCLLQASSTSRGLQLQCNGNNNLIANVQRPIVDCSINNNYYTTGGANDLSTDFTSNHNNPGCRNIKLRALHRSTWAIMKHEKSFIRRRSPACKRRVSYIKALRRWSKNDSRRKIAVKTGQSSAAGAAKLLINNNNNVNTDQHEVNNYVTNVDNNIPDQSDLRRLRQAIFPVAAAAHDDDCVAAAATPYSGTGSDDMDYDINPAALLSQAAGYIMALQVQVDALHALSQAMADSPPSHILSASYNSKPSR